MAKNRDDFRQQTKHVIARRVGYRCSHPECSVETDGPHTDEEKFSSVGIAAHISAASPLGPRFDPNQTVDERKSARNGIWLCGTHAMMIDKDPDNYPTALLISWKKQSEAEAQARNRKLDPQQLIKSEGDQIAFDQISEALAFMKIQKYKRKDNWNDTIGAKKMLSKIEQFSYTGSLRIIEEVAEICDGMLISEAKKESNGSDDISFHVYHCLTEYLRYDRIINPDIEYGPVIQDMVYFSMTYVHYQSHYNQERLPSATILNLVKFIYLRLIRIGDEETMTFIIDRLETLEKEVGKAKHSRLYQSLVRQYQRNLSDPYLGILPFDDEA
jgi:hypothetical protein